MASMTWILANFMYFGFCRILILVDNKENVVVVANRRQDGGYGERTEATLMPTRGMNRSLYNRTDYMCGSA